MSEQLQWQPIEQVIQLNEGGHQIEMFGNPFEGNFHESIRVSRSGQYALVCNRYSTQKRFIDLWNKKEMIFFQNCSNTSSWASFSDEGKFFAVNLDNIEVFETETGIRKANINGGNQISFIPGSESRLVIKRENIYYIYDIEDTVTKVSDFESPGIFRGFSTCGEWLITGGEYNENICAFNIKTQKKYLIGNKIQQRTVLPLYGSNILISHGEEQKLSVVDICSKVIQWEQDRSNDFREIYFSAVSPCGKLISSVYCGHIHVVNSNNGETVCDIKVGYPGSEKYCFAVTAEFLPTEDPSEIKLIVPGTVYPFGNFNGNFGPTIITVKDACT